MNLLLKLSLSQSILITILIPECSVCKVASLVNTFPQAFVEVLRHSLQHGGRNCFLFYWTPLVGVQTGRNQDVY